MEWRTDPRIDERVKVAALVDAALRAPFDTPQRTHWLGQSLLTLDRKDAAAELLSEAVALAPNDAALWLLLARACLANRDHDAAGEAIDAALRLTPDDKSARFLRFRLLIATAAFDSAKAMTDVVGVLPPFDTSLCTLRLRDDAGCAALIEACDAALSDHPGHTNAVYFKALALARLGRDEEARILIDLDNSVEIVRLPLDAAFHTALAAEITANPTLMADRRATRGGLQTLKLDYPGAVHIDALLTQFRKAVETYAARSASWSAARPPVASLNAWAVVYGAHGRQLPHHHGEGWLSGVFYAAAPQTADGGYAGQLILGEVPEMFGIARPPWGVTSITPEPGRLVLFPSYVPHATGETGVNAPRISVAFDVVPVPNETAGREARP